MAGFQYVALETTVEKDSEQYLIELLVFALRYFGFMVSLGGTMICLITQEYLKSMKNESIETQVRGILNYALFFQFGDYTAVLATFIMTITTNLLLWMNNVPEYLAIALNAISFVASLVFIWAFYVIIMRKQKSRALYDDPDFNGKKAKVIV